MSICSVKKVELFVHRDAVDDVLATLQREGCCEISAPRQDGAAEETSAADQTLTANLTEVRYLTRSLAPYYTDPVGSIARAMGERDQTSMEELAALSQATKIKEMADQVRSQERRFTELRTETSQVKSLTSLLSGLVSFPYPLSIVTEGSALTAAVVVTGLAEELAAWQKALEEAFGSELQCQISIPGKKEPGVPWGWALYLRSRERELQELSAGFALTKIEVPRAMTNTVAEELEALEGRLAAAAAEEQALRQWMADFAAQHMDAIRKLEDYWSVLKEQQEALARGEHTAQAVLLHGWVAQSQEERLQEVLSPYQGLIQLTLRDPDEGEEPPIILQNASYAQPFETLTVLYGAPQYGTIDPSFHMMPFFLLFFGMCYGDAGYGLVVVALIHWAMKKFPRMPEQPRRFLTLLKYCGWATVFYGAVTGAWMGNMIDAMPFLSFLVPLKNLPMLLDPMASPMLLLGISLGLGVIHLFYGLALALWDNVSKKNYFEACCDQGGWFLLLIGLLVLGAGSLVPALALPGKVMSIVGALVLIATQGREKPTIFGKLSSGVLSLYNVTGYLGDMLSYSRLLALGLVGGAVAMIINLMTVMCGGVPYVGWLIGLAIFVGGHVFSMVINILGAFVHPLRLQYVEFFGKFYSSGGTMFNPFCYRTRYVTIADGNDD